MKQKASGKDKAFIFVLLLSILIVIVIISLPKDTCVSGHKWSTLDKNSSICETTEVCSVCGETRKLSSHDWVGGTCQTPKVCSRCGEEGYKEPHQYAFGKCKVCRESESFYTFTEEDDEDDFWFAVTSAQNLVKEELKAPSTAKFPWESDEYNVKKNGSDWKISGYVDAKNSFGVSIRTYWTAIFTMGDTSGSTYKVSNYVVTFP